MPKGYWIAHVTVTNPDRYKDYVAANGKAFAMYGGRFIVRGGTSQIIRGLAGRSRHVVIEFDSYEQARACYASPEYQAAEKIRDEAATVDLVIVEGYAG
jgi:uncharacterized protein (DUF1330 family)